MFLSIFKILMLLLYVIWSFNALSKIESFLILFNVYKKGNLKIRKLEFLLINKDSLFFFIWLYLYCQPISLELTKIDDPIYYFSII